MSMRSFSVLVTAAAAVMVMSGCATQAPMYQQGGYGPQPVYVQPAVGTPTWYQPGRDNPLADPYSRESQQMQRQVNRQNQRYYSEQQRAQQQANGTARVIGTLGGAILGNKVGQPGSNERALGTAIGAVAGRYAADHMTNPCAPEMTANGVLLGTAGALVGGSIGSGRGRDAAAAAGALIGTNAGNASAPRRPSC